MSDAMRAVVQQIVKNTAGWEAITSIIPNRVLCVELTSDNTVKIKIGDGLRTWSTLPYVSTGSVDLSNYYNKTQTDAAIATAITNLGSIMILKGIVSSRENLPASNNSVGDVYLVGTTGSTIDDFEEFVWTAANKWEYIGKIGTDMSVYYTKTETNGLLDDKVDKVSGKGLSTEDYTTTEKNKLAGLSNYDDTSVNNNMVRASAADSNGQNQLFKTVNGTTTNLDPKCSFATSSDQIKLNVASTTSNTDVPILCGPSANPTTVETESVYKVSELTFNASKDELKTTMFKGGINTLVDHEAHSNVNNWRKICEFSTNGHSNASGQCALSATILVTDGKYTSPKKGDALLRIVTHKEIKSGAFNNIINNFTMDLCTGTVVDNALSYKDPSSFKLTYTTNGTEITYKLWYYINRTYLSTNFILLSATSSYDTKSIVSEVDLSMGTLSADYMNDNGVAATAAVDCVLGVIANDIEGNAKTATTSTQTTQTLTTSNNNRPLLLSSSTNTSDTTTNINGTVQRANNIYANASTGALTATSFVGNLTGNATSSTSISKNQDLLFDGVFTNNSLVIQDLFTNWKLIFMQLTWVKNQTTYTRELVLPLNILVAKTAFTIRLHTGDQVVFWKVDNNTIKHGTTYNDTKKFFDEAIVMGIY